MSYITGGPTGHIVAVTPSDTVAVLQASGAPEPAVFDWLRVGAAGDVTIVTPDGSTILVDDALAGEYIPIRGYRVNATATAATLIIAGFPDKGYDTIG